MSHKNFDSLRKAVLAKAKEGMRKDVMTYAKTQMVQATLDEVYKVYETYQYSRRRYSGGLLDEDNIIGNPLSSNRRGGFDYEIYNNTKTNFKGSPEIYLTPLVVLGQKKAKSYGFDSEYLYYSHSEHMPYAQPRDFISATKRRLNKGTMVSLLEGHMNKR
ncbi:hypothetical protein [Paenibacillus sp. Mc5Re-14]|uniref:hypothetical protein n=1 Tax=Paenibacillus sp. Mc5Re-14 TaxID=1030529 RepID=UPI000B283824|nr:hypothetical protein [Paenibacillus sp. Mc5Re-14]